MFHRRSFLVKLLGLLGISIVAPEVQSGVVKIFPNPDAVPVTHQTYPLRGARRISWQYNGKYAVDEYAVPPGEVEGFVGMVLGDHMRDLLKGKCLRPTWRPKHHDVFPHLVASKVSSISPRGTNPWVVSVVFEPAGYLTCLIPPHDPILHGDPYAEYPRGTISAQ